MFNIKIANKYKTKIFKLNKRLLKNTQKILFHKINYLVILFYNFKIKLYFFKL